MSLQRCASPVAAAGNVFKFTSASLARSAPLVTRTFSYSANVRLSSTRKLMTETTYTPHKFDFPLPSPRNVDVPDTSIAGGAKSTLPGRPARDAELSTAEKPTVSVTEQEAQKTSAQTSAQQKSSTETSRPKRKLRARKAAMILTPTAVSHLKELLELPEPKLIRVGVKNRGCSGLAYNLEYVDKAGMFDETLEQDGVKVLIDSKALFSIIGSEMDWVEDKLSQRFVFKNPNITEQCGCGESFSVG